MSDIKVDNDAAVTFTRTGANKFKVEFSWGAMLSSHWTGVLYNGEELTIHIPPILLPVNLEEKNDSK